MEIKLLLKIMRVISILLLPFAANAQVAVEVFETDIQVNSTEENSNSSEKNIDSTSKAIVEISEKTDDPKTIEKRQDQKSTIPKKEDSDSVDFGDDGEWEEVVISSTLTPQRVEEAPSIISSISQSEIQRMGYYSLEELLRNVVGFGINQNGHWPDTGVRGINDRTTYGDKIQIIIDNHDMGWRQFNRNYHNYSWISLDEVSRVEIIRGPGAALWGAGALSGLVRVILKPHKDINQGEFVLRNDNGLNHQAMFTRFGTNYEKLSIYGSFYYYTDDADSILSPIREFRKRSNENIFVKGDAEDGLRFNFKTSYKKLTLSWTKNKWETQAPLSTYSIFGGDDSRFIIDRDIISLNFQDMIGSTVEVSAYMSMDSQKFGEGTVYEANPTSSELGDPASGGAGRYLRRMSAEDRRYNLRLSLNYVPVLNFQALLGTDLEYLDMTRLHFPEVWASQSLEIPKFSNWHSGVFGQIQYSPWSFTALTAGLRFDYDQVYGGVINPRTGLVIRLPKGFNIKGLFGTAFKSPSFHDLYYFRRDAFYGNPNLTPEKSMTTEVQLIYKPNHQFDFKLTAFNFKMEDLIGYEKHTAGQGLNAAGEFPTSQRPSGDKDYNQKTNLGSVTSQGLEFEGKVELHPRVQVQAQGTLRVPEDEAGERLNYSAEWSAGGSIRLKADERLSLVLRGLGVGDKQVPARAFEQEGLPSWTAEADPTLKAPAYFVATTLVNYKDFLERGVDLQLKLDNITNQEWWDAGRELLYPQKQFQAMIWLRAPLKP